jgi:hypothetical protein
VQSMEREMEKLKLRLGIALFPTFEPVLRWLEEICSSRT